MNILTMQESDLVGLKYIEESLLNLQMKIDIEKNLAIIRDTLNSIFTTDICDKVTIGKNTETFYGMSVFLTEESTYGLAKYMVYHNASKDITKYILKNKLHYYIEIDSKALYSKIYNLKSNHLMSMLLHEIGHVLADTDFYNDLAMAYQNAIFNIEKNKDYFKTKISNKDVNIASVFLITSIFQSSLCNAGIDKEMIADQFCVKCGYGKDLQDAIDLISKHTLLKYKKENKKSLIDKDAEMFYNLSKQFDIRRKYITSLIDSEAKISPVGLIKKLLGDINNKLKNTLFTENGIPLFSKLNNPNMDMINESFISDFVHSPLKVSQSDIDELKIEKEMMEDYDDKSILVYKIHKRLSQLEKCKQSNENNKNIIKIIDKYNDELNLLLKDTMKFKITPKTYGVFIKYPKGYEG